MDQSITHIRPRFKFVVDLPYQEVMERVKALKTASEAEVVGTLIDDVLILDIPERSRHYWSPQLTLRAEADEDDDQKTVIRGLIGPRPAVWTMFVFIYFGLGITGFFVGSYGMVQWMMGTFSYMVLAIPFAFLFMLTAYQTGKYGEKLGAEQVEILKQFVRHALDLNSSKQKAG